ncbi:MAG TPA: sigma-70 family RNA polymerase sigma factor [Lacunisphaera sp.]|nr:sigma-70 family RNA polymerase sigma factor [Lacunisphaera sp.]
MPDHPGSPRDFARLYRATVIPLRRYLSRFLRDRHEAQDVAHDAFLRIRPVLERQPVEKPEALLYTTARRLALNQLKRRHISPVASSTDQADAATATTPGVVQQVIARQELAQLEQAMAQLPEGCRAVLLLRKLELLSHQEIADRLGIAVSTVEKQHARALRLLRAGLARQTDAGPSLSSEARP